MRMPLVLAMIFLGMPARGHAQELAGADRQKILDAARAHYYHLTTLGLKSFTCGVNFDLSTISKALLPETDAADRMLLQNAVFVLQVTASGPMVRYQFPEGSVSQSQDVVSGVTLWITEIVQGFFQTWPAKGFDGPIPRDKLVQTVARDGDGYRVDVKSANGSSEVRLDKELVVREVLSRGRDGEVDEHPAFAATPDGLVFAGNETVDRSRTGVTKVRYTIEQGEAGGVRLPRAVHLVIGEHVDVRFALSGCKVVTGKR